MGGATTPSAKPRRRDRILASFRPNRNTLAVPASGSLLPQANITDTANCSLLDNVLEQLPAPDRAIVQAYLPQGTSDLNLELALNAAEAKRQICIKKRWNFTLAGRTISLEEEAGKVVKWLNRFKSVGDVAVNAAPLYAGLPWAGFRLLLEVRTALVIDVWVHRLTYIRLLSPKRTRSLLC